MDYEFLLITLQVAVALFLLFSFAYLLSVRNKNIGIIDSFWGLSFITTALVSSLNNNSASTRSGLLLLLITVWGLRLSKHIYFRNKGKPEDFRYADLRKKWKANFHLYAYTKVFLLQGAISLFLGLPIIYINSAPPASINILNVVGVAVWTAGLVTESIADYQLYRFKQNKNNAGKLFTQGLWKYSRHPNYFGETLVWWGIFLICISTDLSMLFIYLPISISYLLIKITGIPLLERKHRGNEKFSLYKKSTSSIIPWFTDNRFPFLKKLLVCTSILFILSLYIPYLIPLPKQENTKPELMTLLPGQFINIDGIKTFYTDDGPKSAPVVILVHGFGGSTYNWRYTIPSLRSNGFRVITLDLKGFGLSEKSPHTNYSHTEQAAFILKLMDNLQIKTASLVGHSMGANIVSIFAQNYPNRLNSLVLVDGNLITSQVIPFDLNRRFVEAPPVRRFLQALMLNFLTPENLKQGLSSAYYNKSKIDDKLIASYQNPLKISGWEQALIGIIRDSSDSVVDVDRVPTPLIIWGEFDTWITVERGEQLANMWGTDIKLVEDSGHLPMEENPDSFNNFLLKYLLQNTSGRL